MKKTAFLHSNKITELAAGKVQSAALGGKRKAAGDISFTAQPVANDTFTINGVVFTAKAAGAAGNQFNIGADLTSSITALVTVLNASIDPAVSVATYSNVGGTKLHVAYDTYGAAGNAFTLAEVSAGATTVATLSGGLDADKLDLDAETKALSTAAGSLVEFDLPAGEEGQETTLYLASFGAGANAQVNGAFVGGTKLTFSAAGQLAKLKFLGASWAPIANTGAIAA